MPTPLFKKGQSGNPKGRPKGSKNFPTLVDETVKEIAKENNISEQEAWKILIKRQYKESSKGNYQFFKDLMDRYYGKPKENIDMQIELPKPILNRLSKNVSANNSNGQDITTKEED